MARTSEQIVADDALTIAIEAYGYVEHGRVSSTLEYVVVVAQQTLLDEEAEDSFCTLYRDGGVSHTRVLGLLMAAARTLEAQRG